MTGPSDFPDESGFSLSPLWSEQEIESLLTGDADVDPDLDQVMSQLRTLTLDEPTPSPRADVLAMLERGLTAPSRKRKVIVGVVATLGVSSLTLASAAAASETVRRPLGSFVHKVVDTFERHGTDTPNPSLRPARVQPRATPSGLTTPTNPGGLGTRLHDRSSEGAPGAAPPGGRTHAHQGASGTEHEQDSPVKGGQPTPEPPPHQRGGQGEGQGQSQGQGHGHAYGHDKEHGQGQGEGHGHAYGHDKEHGQGQGQGQGHDKEHGQGQGHTKEHQHGHAKGKGSGQSPGHAR